VELTYLFACAVIVPFVSCYYEVRHVFIDLLQEFVINRNLFKHIDSMLNECEQKAAMCKQLNYKSGFHLIFARLYFIGCA